MNPEENQANNDLSTLPVESNKAGRPRLALLLAIAAVLLLVLCSFLVMRGIKFVRARLNPTQVQAESITRCDFDPVGICVESFGADFNNQMVINLQLPDEDFPDFHARVEHRGAVIAYACERVDENPIIAYCSGSRTALGEPIVLRLYALEGDRLLAEGSLMVAAVIMPTYPAGTAAGTSIVGDMETPSSEPSSPGNGTPPATITPGGPTQLPGTTPGRPTPTPPVGYP